MMGAAQVPEERKGDARKEKEVGSLNRRRIEKMGENEGNCPGENV